MLNYNINEAISKNCKHFMSLESMAQDFSPRERPIWPFSLKLFFFFKFFSAPIYIFKKLMYGYDALTLIVKFITPGPGVFINIAS